MCGIAGFVNILDDSSELVKLFIDSINHRGPDDNGFEIYKRSCIINTRLSIIDINLGHQPIISEDRNVVLVQNGEIYNYIEIKSELIAKGHSFKTNSDTEVLLHAYLEFGETFVEKLNGMFAIAIIDKTKNTLYLYRDRLGVKPLYIYQKGSEILFSSEIKTFKKYSKFDNIINKQSIHNYLIFNYVPLPNTIFENVQHVKPGSYLIIDIENSNISERIYWNIENNKESLILEDDEYIELIEDLLIDATKIRLRSDVPVGAFLSGGLDSSLICALMRNITNKEFDTYTIGFNEKEYDESEYATYVAKKYGLKNHIKIMDSDITSLWDITTWHNDQPHGDMSFIPTYILSKFTSKNYKLVLTGDGGDELFAGYNKHFSLINNKVEDIGYFNGITLFNEYDVLTSLYAEDFGRVINPNYASELFKQTINKVSEKDDINKALFFDVVQLLPGNNLVKPDKMAMANGLETRSPFLDYRLYELMFKVPGNFKLRDKESKYILKKLSLKYFDYNHVYRKKQMFTVPIGEWFKNKLKNYLIEIIESKSFKSRQIFNQSTIEKMVSSHINNKSNYTRELRAIVNLEIWFRKFID